MLELKNIRKAYVTAGFTQVALDDVSVAFRDNEFVAVLGASGSGKTTMLNILGGLDHADSGDIVINGISTKDYSDKDWDTYRNHRIGFIFQSYNLIPHQTVLSNVELALTLAGVDRSERKERAKAALERVGLGEHINKRPNQLSGGQMQRVAIARALVNDPDIVLADEPTGALDTETGIQVMDLLKEIASERLVIMVTHNPELAEHYATRIVRLSDGRIIDDTNPIMGELPSSEELADIQQDDYQSKEQRELGEEGQGVVTSSEVPAEAAQAVPPSDSRAQRASEAKPSEELRGTERTARDHIPARHASMSFLTALALSFNNLMTKKGRTFMTAFAGSIGIIGIAAILSLSNGVNDYIARTEEEALSSYPLTITKSSFDLTSMMMAEATAEEGESPETEADSEDEGQQEAVEQASADDGRLIPEYTIMSDMFARVKNNDLRRFKAFLESGESGIEPYVNTIQYTYGITPFVYAADTSSGVVRLNPSKMSQTMTNGVMGSAFVGGMTAGAFQELMDDQHLLEQQNELVEGKWPEAYDECVLVTTRGGWLSDYTLYSLGVHDPKVMEDMTNKALAGQDVVVPEISGEFTKEDALALRFKVVPAVNLYQKNTEQGTWTDMTGDKEFMRRVVDDGVELKVVGIVRPAESARTSTLSEGIAYSPLLTQYLMQVASESQIVSEQQERPDYDVFTGKTFEELQNDEQNEFDLSSMFVIDEDALQRAFSFDTSALSSFGSGMSLDLSGMDLSGMDLGSAMSDLDLSQVDYSALSSIFNEQTLASLIANVPEFSLDETGLDEEGQAAAEAAANQLANGFVAWVISSGKIVPGQETDFAALFEEYLQLAEVQAMLDGLGDSRDIVVDGVEGYAENQFAPYVQNSFTQLINQAAQAIALQLAMQMQAQMAAVTGQIGSQLSYAISSQLSSQMAGLASSLENAFSFDSSAFANAIQFNMTQEDLTSLLSNYMNAEELSYDANMKKLGYADSADPESVSIYPIDFPSKESVLGIIDTYNDRMVEDGEEDAAIQYSDFAGVLMGSVTDIVNTISLVLIAFVSISLVVSSIMISIITYISVLERKKEIGILRAMGASKLNIANIFNAETVIEGFIAGVLAVTLVYIVSIPVNEIVLRTKNVPNIMQLPLRSAVILVCISVLLTLIAGLIPSSAASRRDPVEALRSE